MNPHYTVIIVGGGQAGLSMSYCLKQRHIDHIIFEKHQVGHSWRHQRWDSFCLVTPNWQCQLPGYPYPGGEPQGFMEKDKIVNYLEDYAASFNPPLQEGVAVSRVRQDQKVFEVTTSIGDYTADQVVIAVGSYHRPILPALTHKLPPEIFQIHSRDYKNPESLPGGSVLIVGTGQSGCQIAEDLHLAGKKVYLSVGSAPRSPRKYRGKDVVDWLDQMGYYDLAIDDHPQKEKARKNTNHYLTGRDGGREIDLRQFAIEGMQLCGRLTEINQTKLRFKDDLKENLDTADAVAENIKKTIDVFIEKNGLEVPKEPPYKPVWEPHEPILELDSGEIDLQTVIWSTGYSPDFSWIDVPVFNGKGEPSHQRGVTDIQGLYFLGLPWLYTWGSARFSGIARDANYLADYIAMRKRGTYHPNPWQVVNEFLLGS